MNRMLVWSVFAHLVVFAGLTIANLKWIKPGYYTGQRVYQVNLVSLPPGSGGTVASGASRLREPADRAGQDDAEEPQAKVVSRKEAAKPVPSGPLAMQRIPKLTAKKQAAASTDQGSGTQEGSGQPGGSGSGSFATGTQGVRLDIENFEFPYYLDAIQRKIQQNLFSPRLAGVHRLQTIVYFKIARNGHVYDIKIRFPSGVLLFNNAALRALKTADPLPPLPDGFTEEYLGVHFVFEYVQ